MVLPWIHDEFEFKFQIKKKKFHQSNCTSIKYHKQLIFIPHSKFTLSLVTCTVFKRNFLKTVKIFILFSNRN